MIEIGGAGLAKDAGKFRSGIGGNHIEDPDCIDPEPGRFFGLNLSPFFPPGAEQGGFVLAHNHRCVGSKTRAVQHIFLLPTSCLP
jgi:hypothetical protein